MKRVLFGYKGGFPLEQETLIQIQKAYSVDMLDALFALWGLDSKSGYLIKMPTNDVEDGWIIYPFETIQVNPVDGTEIKVEKPQLLRLKYQVGATQVKLVDLREQDGSLEYAQAGPDGKLEKKVYEEFVGQLVTNNGDFLLTDLISLDSILAINAKIANNQTEINTVKENYLPRDGSKPMTGDLNLGGNNALIFNKADNNNIDYIKYNDGSNPQVPDKPNPGVFDFVAEKPEGEKGNDWVRSGGVITNKVGIGVPLPSKAFALISLFSSGTATIKPPSIVILPPFPPPLVSVPALVDIVLLLRSNNKSVIERFIFPPIPATL